MNTAHHNPFTILEILALAGEFEGCAPEGLNLPNLREVEAKLKKLVEDKEE